MNNSTDNIFAAIPEWAFYEQFAYSGIVALIGIPGNILVILVFIYSREKSTTDYMVFSMAASDLLGSFVCTTFNILRNIPAVWGRIGSTSVCRLGEYFGMLTAACSMWLLSVIAVDRYMKTCRPHYVLFTVFKARLICVIVCAVVATVSGPASLAVRFDHISGGCLVLEENKWTIALNTIIVGCCLSFLVTTLAYIFVAFALCRRLKEKMRRRRTPGRSPNTATVSSKEECCTEDCDRKLENQSDLGGPSSHSIDVIQVSVIEKAPNVLGFSDNKNTKSEHRSNEKAGMDEVLRQERKRVNRTTVIMFLITAINISTFILLMTGYLLAEEKVQNPGVTFGYIVQTSYMANYITNPLFYMSMSSRFRDNVRKLFQRR